MLYCSEWSTQCFDRSPCALETKNGGESMKKHEQASMHPAPPVDTKPMAVKALFLLSKRATRDTRRLTLRDTALAQAPLLANPQTHDASSAAEMPNNRTTGDGGGPQTRKGPPKRLVFEYCFRISSPRFPVEQADEALQEQHPAQGQPKPCTPQPQPQTCPTSTSTSTSSACQISSIRVRIE